MSTGLISFDVDHSIGCRNRPIPLMQLRMLLTWRQHATYSWFPFTIWIPLNIDIGLRSGHWIPDVEFAPVFEDCLRAGRVRDFNDLGRKAATFFLECAQIRLT